MAEPLVALQVQTPTVNGAANYIQGAQAATDQHSQLLAQANASIGLMGQVALGAMGGNINGQADPQKWAQGQALLKAHGIDMSQYGPDTAPTLARASISTLGQLQQANSQRDFQLSLAQFANTMKQQGVENTRANAQLQLDQNAQAYNQHYAPTSIGYTGMSTPDAIRAANGLPAAPGTVTPPNVAPGTGNVPGGWMASPDATGALRTGIMNGMNAPPASTAAPAIGGFGVGANGLPLGTTGTDEIDATAPGYSSHVVAAGLTQAAIDQAALSLAASGSRPPIGRTGIAGQQATIISNRMAELDAGGNLSTNKAKLKALSGSLATQQKYLDTTQRSINNAELGFQQVLDTFNGKVNPSQFPTINAWSNAAQSQFSPGEISAFKSGLQEVANEYTQVFSRGGQVTDSVRNRANDIVNGNLSLPDLQKVLDELQAQGKIVVGGAQKQVQQITDQINGIVSSKKSGSDQGSSSPKTFTYNADTGELE